MLRDRCWSGLGAALCTWLLLLAGAAPASEITFDDMDLSNGTIVNDQYEAEFGLTISAVNLAGGPDLAVLFDTSLRGTADPDLEYAKGGNLAFFNALIIQENQEGCDDVSCDRPDDEGANPAGALIFAYQASRPILDFGFDLLDIEEGEPENFGSIVFCNGGAAQCDDGEQGFVGRIEFGDFVRRDDAVFGDNTANRIAPIDLLTQFGIESADTVVFEMAGSGAIDNISFALVPEPATAAMLALGLAGLAWQGRRL